MLPEKPTEPSRNGRFRIVAIAGLALVAAVACRPSAVYAQTEIAAWGWGANNHGQLGDGTLEPRLTPVLVQNSSGFTAVAAGDLHSLALKDDGTVRAWGFNLFGQLGDGTTDERHTPVQVQNLSGVRAIASGVDHSLALKSDGTVLAWGRNRFGQLGDGTTDERHSPVQVQNLSGITAVAAGDSYSLALRDDGTVWAWGANFVGELGDGTTTDRHTPVQVQNLSGVTAIACGDNHSLAVKSDGSAWAWGNNDKGQLGDGTPSVRLTPVQVLNLSGVKFSAGGHSHSVALKRDGTVWAWGWNVGGQLGDGSNMDRHTPVQVGPAPHLSEVTAIAAHTAHSLSLRSSGTVQAWGSNSAGQLGDGTTFDRSFPVQAENLIEATAIAVGTAHSLAVGTLRPPQLTVFKILKHPDANHLRLFNLQIDGVTVRANVNSGSTGPQTMSPGNHTVSEKGGTGTSLSDFGTVIGGDCAADGSVSLAPGDFKTCTITNFDHSGGCRSAGAPPRRSVCCEPGDGTEDCQPPNCSSACQKCSPAGGECN